jgi:hypothetical protein
MHKKIIMALVALTLVIPVSAKAALLQNKTVVQPTIAILDTAVDTSVPYIKNNIIFEACIEKWATCPNGMPEMEGTNSAILPANIFSSNGFDHGTIMASSAVQTNSNVRIVFVRIIGVSKKGVRQPTSEQTVWSGLEWVIRNKTRFNIQAVSLSMGHHDLGAEGTDYCPKTPITEDKIKVLADMNVPVFFPAGNGRDYSRVDWPSCIKSAVTIAASTPNNEIAIYTNYDSSTVDFFANGTVRAYVPGNKLSNVAGTSASTVIAATQWATIAANKPNLTYNEIYDLFSKTSISISNSKITGGKLIDLSRALNG